ncbi:hypothetical protein [Phenylobacterium sp. Root700]|uniref:hypothetical protein n=1 Tax=Phenylobacterium sp. Root700 TaxID=1736591 RepID=UPI0006F61C18|nr:hypothetical protein [Phenylobacterium sp. Root700]KRB52542.1 hypothetical protein ASE02_11170 [Phenylobacterium sp. Root700]
MALTQLDGGMSLEPQKAFYFPVGAASPLWFMFAGAASAGVAYWWMTRWAERTNLEAVFGAASPAEPVELPAPAAEVVEVAAISPEQVIEPVAAALEDVVAAAPEPEAIIESAPEPVVDEAPKPKTKPRAASDTPPTA